MKISMKLVYQYMTIFFNFSPTSNHRHPLQVENCDSNLRLVVDEDDNGKFRLESVKAKVLITRNKYHNLYHIIDNSAMRIVMTVLFYVILFDTVYFLPMFTILLCQRKTR